MYNFSQTYWDDTQGADPGGIWGVGYFVSTVGIDEKTIQAYVASQEHEEVGQLELEL